MKAGSKSVRKPGCSSRSGPGHQQPQSFLAEVPAGGHVDHHGQMLGQSRKRLGGNQHAAQRFDRQFRAGHSRDTGGPGPGSVHNCTGAETRAVGGFHAGNVAVLRVDAGDFGSAPQLAPCSIARAMKPVITLFGINESVGGAEASADDVVGANLRQYSCGCRPAEASWTFFKPSACCRAKLVRR